MNELLMPLEAWLEAGTAPDSDHCYVARLALVLELADELIPWPM
jgi:hypothetical protein